MEAQQESGQRNRQIEESLTITRKYQHQGHQLLASHYLQLHLAWPLVLVGLPSQKQAGNIDKHDTDPLTHVPGSTRFDISPNFCT